jgi:hypothetical protein
VSAPASRASAQASTPLESYPHSPRASLPLCHIVLLSYKTTSLADLGVNKKRAARAGKLDGISEADVARYIAQLKAEGKGVTPNAILAKSRQEAKRKKKSCAVRTGRSTVRPETYTAARSNIQLLSAQLPRAHKLRSESLCGIFPDASSVPQSPICTPMHSFRLLRKRIKKILVPT